MQYQVIAQMIVRNEADRYLTEVLEHLAPIVDKIVITDDASTDDTVAICKKYTTHVYENEEPMFTVHEGRLRQGAWDNLCNHATQGDLVLAIDADEKPYFTKWRFDDLAKTRYDVFGIDFYHMWNETHYRVDKAWAPVTSSRLFRFFPNGRFRDRRLACSAEPQYVRDLIAQRKFYTNTGILMQHLGYCDPDAKRAKYERYMTLDGGEFHSRAHLESILDPNPTLVSWEDNLKNLTKERGRQ